MTITTAGRSVSQRLTNDLAAGRDQLPSVTDRELAAEVEQYVDMRDGEMHGDDRAVLLEARRRIVHQHEELDILKHEYLRMSDFLRRQNYDPCDIPACNCGLWHKRGPRNDSGKD